MRRTGARDGAARVRLYVRAVTDPAALELDQLTKRYDDGFLALDRVDLRVGAGEFFGLLGPNGAGKTTLISAVCNLIRVTEGEARVFGHPHDAIEARKLVGLAEQDVNLDRFLDVEETLRFHGGYYGMDRAHARRRAREMMDVFDLRAKAGVRAPKLSGGMRRRLLLARALMHEPRLVILDEPTAGVDFELRLELWRYIRRLHETGTTILLDDALPRGSRGAVRGDRADPRRADHRARLGRRPARRLPGGVAGRRVRQGDGGLRLPGWRRPPVDVRVAAGPPGRATASAAAGPPRQRFGTPIPHIASDSHGEWPVTVILRLPLESWESRKRTHSVLFAKSLSRNLRRRSSPCSRGRGRRRSARW